MRRASQEKQSEMERCVVCGCETKDTKEAPIHKRIGCGEGAGRLCRDCHQDLDPKGPGCHG